MSTENKNMTSKVVVSSAFAELAKRNAAGRAVKQLKDGEQMVAFVDREYLSKYIGAGLKICSEAQLEFLQNDLEMLSKYMNSRDKEGKLNTLFKKVLRFVFVDKAENDELFQEYANKHELSEKFIEVDLLDNIDRFKNVISKYIENHTLTDDAQRKAFVNEELLSVYLKKGHAMSVEMQEKYVVSMEQLELYCMKNTVYSNVLTDRINKIMTEMNK